MATIFFFSSAFSIWFERSIRGICRFMIIESREEERTRETKTGSDSCWPGLWSFLWPKLALSQPFIHMNNISFWYFFLSVSFWFFSCVFLSSAAVTAGCCCCVHACALKTSAHLTARMSCECVSVVFRDTTMQTSSQQVQFIL